MRKSERRTERERETEVMASIGGWPAGTPEVMARIQELIANPHRMNTTRSMILESLPRCVRYPEKGIKCGAPAPGGSVSVSAVRISKRGEESGEEPNARLLMSEVLDGGGDGRDLILNFGSYT